MENNNPTKLLNMTNRTVPVSRNRRLLTATSLVALAIAPSNVYANTVGDEGGFSIGSEAQSADGAAPAHNVQVRVDGLHVQPVIAAVLAGDKRSAVIGETAQFRTHTNYPALIERGEIRIFEDGRPADGKPLVALAVGEDGTASWAVPSDLSDNLYYVFRAYGKDGRFDETLPSELTLLNEPFASTSDLFEDSYLRSAGKPGDGPSDRVRGGADDQQDLPSTRGNGRAAFGRSDQANIRNIALSDTVTVVVTGQADPANDSVRVSGQMVPVDEDGKFAVKQIVPKQSQRVHVQVMSAGAVKS